MTDNGLQAAKWEGDSGFTTQGGDLDRNIPPYTFVLGRHNLPSFFRFLTQKCRLSSLSQYGFGLEFVRFDSWQGTKPQA